MSDPGCKRPWSRPRLTRTWADPCESGVFRGLIWAWFDAGYSAISNCVPLAAVCLVAQPSRASRIWMRSLMGLCHWRAERDWGGCVANRASESPADLQQRRCASWSTSPVRRPRSTQAAESMLVALQTGSSAMHSTPSSRRLLSVSSAQAETSMQHGDNVMRPAPAPSIR